MRLPNRNEIINLLEEPYKLFMLLYEFAIDNYTTLSNYYFTGGNKTDFENISALLYKELHSYLHTDSLKRGNNLKNMIIQYDPHKTGLLLFILFKALSNYLFGKKGWRLKRIGGYPQSDRFILLQAPPNVIYEKISEKSTPVRTDVGTGIYEIIAPLRSLSLIKKGKHGFHIVSNSSMNKSNTFLKKRIEDLRIAMTPLLMDLEPDVESFNDKGGEKSEEGEKRTPYLFKGIVNSEELRKKLDTILKKCHDENIVILVLPELMIDKELLDYLRSRLLSNNRELVSRSKGEKGILLTVAGSFHFADDNSGNYYNVSTVIDFAGNTLWAQKKMKRYSLNEDDISKNPDLKKVLKISSHGGYENIQETNTIYFADTPAGRIAVIICIDFFHPDHLEAFKNSGVNIFLVPAMSAQNVRFRDTAKLFGLSNASSTFMSNSGYTANKEKGAITRKGASFFYLPDTRSPFAYAEGNDSLLIVYDAGVNKALTFSLDS